MIHMYMCVHMYIYIYIHSLLCTACWVELLPPYCYCAPLSAVFLRSPTSTGTATDRLKAGCVGGHGCAPHLVHLSSSL